MKTSTQTKKIRTISHTRRPRVRTGCRTCKIRKIKCDEERPACRKCVSTGRGCDGYGIWSVPESGRSLGPISTTVGPLTSRLETQLVNTSPLSNLKGPRDIKEQAYLEWFKYSTIVKLPGAFRSGFWDKCLLQTSSSEPAIMHAILALSSAHKRRTLHSGLEIIELPPDPQERFMLRHYSKAITHLQPHLSAKDAASARVALVTCLVFVSLEYLRGHYKAGQLHLQNGLKLLRASRSESQSIAETEVLLLSPRPESIDEWIIDSYARLQAQSDIFGKRSRQVHFVLPTSPSAQTFHFQTAGQARRHLERLIEEIIFLKEEYVAVNGRHSIQPVLPRMLEKQRSLQEHLSTWLKRCELSPHNSPTAHRERTENFAYLLLGIYHITASIMASCVFQHEESIFDAHTPAFVSLISQAIEINRIVTLGSQNYSMPGQAEMSTSITDIGCIPPLFFTAIKCRHHRIRMQAIKFLGQFQHKEGIWDAKLTVSIAREVIRIEEGDFYQGFEAVDDSHLPLEKLEERDLTTLPVLPEERRFHVVEVVLPDATNTRFKIICRKRLADRTEAAFAREYDATLRCWIDGADEKDRQKTDGEGD
ncbi:hypothetical protein K504DRAFT_424718 [Pleomassaria siparia CBS 279.74]|uniref:Zn(2)-C6 fungal-type domain-containing protein n=1 Tax=Pleomassaria siparia CBS 279.74 TaxID=1314801 RepID=A0A6G1KN28_9PLEO|nr:hypothetical protein K504DRAFT_424718 [Pleomassaria siparia CBS 279.74]